MSHHDVVVVGTGLAGLTRRACGSRSRARACSCVAKGVGATHLSGGTIDVLGYAPERVERPREALAALPRRAPLRARRRGRRRGGGRVVQGAGRRAARSRRTPTRATSRRTCCCRRAIGVAAPDGGRARDDGGGRPAARGADLRRRLPRAEGLPRGAARGRARARGLRARAPSSSSSSPERPPRRQRARVRARVRRPGVPRPGRRAGRRARCARGERVAFPAVLGIADPHGAWAALEHGLGRPVFEVPTLPPSVPGMRVFAVLRDALRRAGGTLVLNNVVVGAERDRRPRDRAAHARRAARGAPRGRLGRARHRRLRRRRARARLALDRARDRRSACRSPACPGAGEERFRPGYFDDHPIGRAGVAVDRELRPLDAPGSACSTTCWWPARRWPAPSRGARSPATGSASRPGTARPSSCSPRRAQPCRRGRAAMTDVLGPLLMRESLDHCVKCTICETFCPVSNVTPLFPGPKYVGPQAERFRVDGEPSFDASLDYCSGCGICTQVCPQGVHIAEINTQARAELKATQRRAAARPDPRAADARRPARHAGRRRSPTGRCATACCGVAAERDDRPPPRRADAALRRAHVPALGAPPHGAGAAGAASRSSTAAGRTTTSRGCGEMTVALLEHNGIARRGAQAGLLRPAAAVERAVRRRARLRAAAGEAARPVRARGRRHRRHVDELHADAQARGARDPRAGGRPGPARRVASGSSTSASTCSRMHERGELATDFRPLPETVLYHAPCQQQGHGDRQAGARPAGARSRSCA